MSKKKKKQYKKRPNYQPKSKTKIAHGVANKEMFMEVLTRCPESVIECVRVNGEYRQIDGRSIQLPIAGNMYGIQISKGNKLGLKVVTDFCFFMTQQFNTRLFYVPLTNTTYVAAEVPIEEVGHICRAILDMYGY